MCRISVTCIAVVGLCLLRYNAHVSGMWYGILQFLNIAGVVSNAFLIAFTSSWGQQFSAVDKLWIVIGFEVGLRRTLQYAPPSLYAQ